MDEDSKTSVDATKQKPVVHERGISKLLLPSLVVLLLMAASAAGAYFWQQAVINSMKIDQDALEQRVRSLESQLSDIKPNSDNVQVAVVPDQTVSDNVKAAIETGNTAALLDVFAPSVNYAIAASEAQGIHTAMQAVKDLDYLASAANPWDFNLPQSELDQYASSIYYGKYFPTKNVMVGKSADGKLVSFIFNSDSKIITLFMSADSDIVKE